MFYLFKKHDLNEGDTNDKVEWSSKNEGIFINTPYEHLKKGDLQALTFIMKICYVIDNEVFTQIKKRLIILKLKSIQ